MLPKEELYMPPMNIRVRDNRQFGRKPMVGISVLKSLEDYRLEPLPPLEDTGDGLDIPSKELSIFLALCEKDMILMGRYYFSSIGVSFHDSVDVAGFLGTSFPATVFDLGSHYIWLPFLQM